MSQNRVIGNQGTMPWKSKEEMAYFKEKTIGHPIIMGRNTWDSLRNRPLKDRFNIVITKNKQLKGLAAEQNEGPVFVGSLKDAIDSIDEDQIYEVFIIGGAQIYEAAMQQDLVDRIYLNVMNFSCVGDTYFPYFEPSQWNKQENQGPWKEFTSYTFTKKVDK